MNGEFCYDSQLKAIEDELYLIERELKQIKIDLNNRNDLCSGIFFINKNELVLRSINTNIDVATDTIGKLLKSIEETLKDSIILTMKEKVSNEKKVPNKKTKRK
jgi:hypothetical protein